MTLPERKEKYVEILTKAVGSLAKEGKSNKEIAAILGISVTTFTSWLAHNNRLATILNDSRAFVERAVEHSLFQLAVGYAHPETKVFYDSKTGDVVTHKVMKHYPPDLKAIQFILKNISPEKWKERTEITIGGDSHTVSSVEEARRILRSDPSLLGPEDGI